MRTALAGAYLIGLTAGNALMPYTSHSRLYNRAAAGNVHFNPDEVRRLADAARANGRIDEAAVLLRALVENDANDLAACTDLAHTLADSQQHEEALACYRRAVALAPRSAIPLFNLGCALRDIDRLEEAADAFARAAQVEPGYADAHLNHGITLRELGRTQDAIAAFDRVLSLRSDDPQAHLQRALAWLAAGEFAHSWDEYEWRWRAELEPVPPLVPRWDGGSLCDKSLLVRGEQGIGDEIMFASCLGEIARQTRRCGIECDPRLATIFARSFPLVEIYPRPLQPGNAPGARFDVEIPLGSVPRFVRRSRDAYPCAGRYLIPDASAVARWKIALDALGPGLKVGLAWKGGRRGEFQRRRSTHPAVWSQLLQTPGVQFVSVQHGEVSDDLSQLRSAGLTPGAMLSHPEVRRGVGEHAGCNGRGACLRRRTDESMAPEGNAACTRMHTFDGFDAEDGFDDFAALIAALDLVISVDNSTVHLAGALGTETWVLLPFAADYRWLTGTETSPWYASLRLYRQPKPGDWTSVFARVSDALLRRIGSRAHP